MKIGVTERGDAGIDLSWTSKLENNEVNGAVLITKNITPAFIDNVGRLNKMGKKIIVHATTTGWGGSVVEPHVPTYQQQIKSLVRLIEHGSSSDNLINQDFPAEHCILRIDPIIPTPQGLICVKNVLLEMEKYPEIYEKIRIRVSVLDEYKHVKKRLADAGFASFYPDSQFQASEKQMQQICTILAKYRQNKKIETCAESKLSSMSDIFEPIGCLSKKDLDIMGLQLPPNLTENIQQRAGCHCLSCKTELLSHKHRCPHGCLYCYWND